MRRVTPGWQECRACRPRPRRFSNPNDRNAMSASPVRDAGSRFVRERMLAQICACRVRALAEDSARMARMPSPATSNHFVSYRMLARICARRATLPFRAFPFPVRGYGGLPPCLTHGPCPSAPKCWERRIYRPHLRRWQPNMSHVLPAHAPSSRTPLFIKQGGQVLPPLFTLALGSLLSIVLRAKRALRRESKFRSARCPQNTAQYPAHRRNHSPKKAAIGR